MNFLLGGRLGDLIHACYVAKNTEGKHDIYITDDRALHSDGFLHSIEKTYEELYPIITKQDWCNSFSIYADQDCINLSLWRHYAYSACWTELLAKTFNVPANGEPWVKLEKRIDWENHIILHCSDKPARRGYHWDIVMMKYEPQCTFIGTEDEYNAFGYNVPYYKPYDLAEYFKIINSCKFFIGNQSAPLAIAHALGKNRLAMLNEVDEKHYLGEEKYHNNFYWMNKYNHHFEGLEY